MRKKKKPGPIPMGLGRPFTVRLTKEQDSVASREAKKKKCSKGAIVRDMLGET